MSFGQEPEGQTRRQPAAIACPTNDTHATVTASAQRSFSLGFSAPATEQPTPPPEEPPVITHHEIKVGGKTLRYTATVGMMPIKNRDGETEARMFFMAYTLDNVPAIAISGR